MLVPKNEPYTLIELIDKIPLEKPGIRNPLFQIRSGSTNTQLNSNIQIECIETWDNNIYVGTSDGSIINFMINKYPQNENKFIDGTFSYYKSECHYVQRKTVSDKKPINKIIIIPSESILLVLCDNSIVFLESNSLNSIPPAKLSPIKNVLNVCTDEAVTSNLQICIAKRYSIEYVNFDHGVHQLMEFPHNFSNILKMKCYSNKVCIADNDSYYIFDITTGESIPLFSHNQAYGKPLLNVLDKDEFMFVTSTAQGMGLGVFVSPKGDATRGTLQWKYYPNSIAFQYPYVLALMDDNALAIHNILDQKLIQNIYIPKDVQQPIRIANVRLVFIDNDQQDDAKNLNIKVLLYSSNKLFALTMKPIDFQLKEMMNGKYVNYALFLLEHDIFKDEYYVEIKEAKLRQFYRNAGYVLMKETLFDDALECFKKGSVSPINLINLFEEYRIPTPLTSPIKLEYNDIIPDSINTLITNHMNKNYKDIDETTKISFSQAFYENAKNMLMKYLKFSRKNQIASGKKQEIDTTLLKLYIENNDKKLYDLIKKENYCNIEESIEILKEKKKYYAMGLLYQSKGLFQKALEIWLKIESKQLKDTDFPGIQFIVDFLSNTEDKELVWKYSKWVLNENQKLGAKIFMSEKHKDLDQNNVVSYLEKKWNEAALIYLEYLIYVIKTKDSSFHTNLGLSYIKSIIEYTKTSMDKFEQIDKDFNDVSENLSYISYLKSNKSNEIINCRLKFLNFIQTSEYINPSHLLKKLAKYEILMIEKVYLYSKSFEHEKALKILLHQLNDYNGAEEYCHENQKKCEKQKLAMKISTSDINEINNQTKDSPNLSDLHLNSLPKKNESLYLTLLRLYIKMENRDLLAPKIIKLLNSSYQEFSIKEVLDIIPLHWSLNILNSFLTRSIRNSIHIEQQTKIIKNIVKGENTNVKMVLNKHLDKIPPLIIDNNTKCSLCDNEILEEKFFKTSNGKIVHFNCYNKINK